MQTNIAILTAVFQLISIALTAVWNTVSRVASAVWTALCGFVSSAVATIVAVATPLVGMFQSIFSAVESLVAEVKGFVNDVIGGINGAIGLIKRGIHAGDMKQGEKLLVSTVHGKKRIELNGVNISHKKDKQSAFFPSVTGLSSGGYKAVNGFEKTADRMWVQLDYNGGSYNTMMTNSPVNMTGVSFINFEMYASAQYPENSNVYLCVCPSREIVIGGGDTALAAWSFHGGYGEYSHSGVLSLDVRSLSGNYYIGGLAFSQGYYVQLSLYSIYGS